MQHRRSRLRLTQKPAHSALLQRNLVTSLLLYEAIRTTRKRARVIQPIVDRLIANAKRQNAFNAVRALNSFVTDKNASRKVMEVLIKRYASRPSGFTKVTAVGSRKGDGAQLVDMVLVDAELSKAAPADSKKATAKTKPAKKTATVSA